MKKISLNQTDKPIKQFTPVYHNTLGVGSVVTVNYRKDNNLIMCFFPKGKVTEWIGEKELRSGMGDIRLSKVSPSLKEDEVSPTLETVLRSLFDPQ